ncbi:MAG: tetratricopeptide repeat protein [Gammaproteobacteria bacterium]|jgi:tetratricopeptide (TPR) repeat protein|nr:tetratricopeptide repeat protein [Gammaproteobacteria bacterium]
MKPIVHHCLACILALALSAPLIAAAQQGMSADLHRQAQEINELMQADKHAEAIRKLEPLRKRGNLNDYEKAVLAQLLGYAHANGGQYREAAAAFEEALSFGSLPAEVAGGISIALAQTYMETRDFDRARTLIERILSAGHQAEPDFLAVAAYVYYELKDYATAERHAQQAIAQAKEPQESWYQILLAIYRAQQQWQKAEALLRNVVARYPDNFNYWQFLSYALYEQNRESESLATLMLAYRLDLIEGDELERLVGMHANVGIPEKAARLLAEWLDDGSLEANEERISLNGRLWLLARERSKAMEAIGRAAELSKEGDSDLLLAKLHYEDERWEDAVRHFQAALSKGVKEDTAQLHLLLGISAYNVGENDLARTALETASKHREYQKHTRYWLNRLSEPRG